MPEKSFQIFQKMLQRNPNKLFGQPNTMGNTFHKTFTKLIECKMLRVNPKVSYVWQNPLQYCKVISLQLIKKNKIKKKVSYCLCVIMAHQSRSIDCKTCTILEWDVGSSSGCAWVGTRNIQQISEPTLYFVTDLKIRFVSFW